MDDLLLGFMPKGFFPWLFTRNPWHGNGYPAKDVSYVARYTTEQMWSCKTFLLMVLGM